MWLVSALASFNCMKGPVRNLKDELGLEVNIRKIETRHSLRLIQPTFHEAPQSGMAEERTSTVAVSTVSYWHNPDLQLG